MKLSNIWSRSIPIALVLLLSGANSDTPKPGPRATPNNHRKRTAEQKQTTNPGNQPNTLSQYARPVTGTIPSGPTSDGGFRGRDSDSAEQERHDRIEERLEGKLVRLTAVLALIEIGTAVIFWFSLNAAIRAAKAAEGVLRESQKANAISLRAYLYISAVRLRRSGSQIKIAYPVWNAGKTPALYIGERVRFEVIDSIESVVPLKPHEEGIVKIPLVIPPVGNELTRIGPIYTVVVPDEDIANVERGEAVIVFHGFIRYEDISGLPHDTGFGVSLTGPLDESRHHRMTLIRREGFNWFN